MTLWPYGSRSPLPWIILTASLHQNPLTRLQFACSPSSSSYFPAVGPVFTSPNIANLKNISFLIGALLLTLRKDRLQTQCLIADHLVNLESLQLPLKYSDYAPPSTGLQFACLPDIWMASLHLKRILISYIEYMMLMSMMLMAK